MKFIQPINVKMPTVVGILTHIRRINEADLRLCFRICLKPVFSRRGSYTIWTVINKNEDLAAYADV